MTPDAWERAKTVFAAALGATPSRRGEVLARLCLGDADLRREVEALLEAHEREGFVDELARRLATSADTTVDATTPVPTRIGRYDVIERAGAGGMGVVYKAHDPQLDRLVALKLIVPARTLGLERRERLLIEGRAAAALDHPAIATIYEIGETADGQVFLAMAFYEGETLAARLARGPLPVGEAVEIARTMAGGLAAAHARGIVHRDLKPANVLLTATGAVKIVDFGIAKMVGADLTQTSELIGTLAYMAPEQLRGGRVDARVDIWAFGLVLLEMLTGDRTATGLGANVPATIRQIIQRALSPDPNDRYRDATALAMALDEIAGQQPGTGVDHPAVRLPAPITSFVGREREAAEIERLLARARLVTLTGPGGTGKTRLALQVASALAARFDDGAAFVSLAALSDPALVCVEIARVLAIPERAAMSALDSLTSFLRSRRMLLVLDNFEHMTLAASAVAALLSECHDLRVLITSRLPIKVAGEHEYTVRPLAAPPHDRRITAADLEHYPASALFLDRARAVRPDVEITDDQAADIAEICTRLDGLPLAVELAAARMKLLSPRAMRARLDRRFELLTGGSRDQPARHHSLRQAIAWSFDLLTVEEQALFRRLAVFAGSASLEDATAVCEACGSRDALDGCGALIDHSLIVREDSPEGLPRVRMLETIREFALERQHDAGEASEVRRAHALRFLELAETSVPHLTGPDQAAWLDRLELEQDNLRAALAWAAGAREAEIGLRFGAALWRFWTARGHLREGRERLERLLAMPGAEARTLLRARVLNAAGTIIHEISDFPAAQPLVEESLAIAREHGDRTLTALVSNNLAWLLVRTGQSEAAEALCEEAIAFNRAVGDPRGLALALHNLGWLDTIRGNHDRGSALHEESLACRRAHGDARGIGYAMTDLAWAEVERGELNRAAPLLAEARAILEQINDRQLLAWALTIQGVLERARSQPDPAFACFESAIDYWRQVDNIFGLGFALVVDAEMALDCGDCARAARDLDEAVPLLRRTGACFGLTHALMAQARLDEGRDNPARARELYAEARELFARQGTPAAVRECDAALRRLAAVIDDAPQSPT